MSEDNSEHETGERITKPRSIPMIDQLETFTDADPYGLDLLSETNYAELLASEENALPDLRISAKASPQHNFKLREMMIKGISAAARDGAIQGANRYIAKHPHADGLDYKHTGRVVALKYNQVDYVKVFRVLTGLMLERDNGLTTQKALLEEVKLSTGWDLNQNLWKLKLKRYVFPVIINTCIEKGLSIKFNNCKDMSDIKRAIDSHFNAKSAELKLKINLSLSNSKLVINGVSHNISKTVTGNSEYDRVRVQVADKKAWIRVDSLLALLNAAA